MGLIRWIIAVIVLSCWTALIGTALFVALHRPYAPPPAGDVIVVLSGSETPDANGISETRERVERGIALFQEGYAPRIMFSGGGATPNDAASLRMAGMAVEAGVPAEAIAIETLARSTLQNALFVADQPGIAPETSILLVTHRYHLPRALASFRWAGFSDVVGIAADPNDGFTFDARLVYEGGKWPLNILRAAAASAALAGGVPREDFISYLE